PGSSPVQVPAGCAPRALRALGLVALGSDGAQTGADAAGARVYGGRRARAFNRRARRGRVGGQPGAPLGRDSRGGAPGEGQALFKRARACPPPLTEYDAELLYKTYWRRIAADAVAAKLHISRATYYRHLRRATERLHQALAGIAE